MTLNHLIGRRKPPPFRAARSWRALALGLISAGLSFQSLAVTPLSGRAVGWGTSVMLPGTTFTNIAAGYHHTLAIATNGTGIGWGAPYAPAAATNIVAVAAGGGYSGRDFSLALRADHTVLGWTALDVSQQVAAAMVPAGLSNVVAIAAGGVHSLALKGNGQVVAWGTNTLGQTNVPFGLTNVVAVAAGLTHSLALKNDGTAVSWGSWSCTLGTSNVVGIAAGYDYNALLRANGTVSLCSRESNPFQVPGLSNAMAIAVGGDQFYGNHLLALRSDGTVFAWGNNTFGQSTVPFGLSNVVAVAAGAYHSVALKSDGTIIGWGSQTNFPVSLSDIAAVAAGSGNMLALRADGTVVDWDGYQNLPAGLTNITAIAAGDGNGLALRKNGTVVAWGNNTYGQSFPPAGLNGVAAIATGPYHSLSLKTNGTVVAWGHSPEADVPSALSDVAAISTVAWTPPIVQGGSPPGAFSLALRSNGTVVAWGYHSNIQTNVPAGLSNVTAIAAGAFHALTLRSDGTVFGWGYNRSGEATGIPAPASPYNSTGQVTIAGQVLSNVVAIAAGHGHSLALKNDGTIVGWGYNYYGEATVPSGISNVVAIAAGEYESLAITIDLKIASIEPGAQGPLLSFHTFAGQQYSVEFSPGLSPASWNPLPGGPVVGDGQDAQVTDTNAGAGTRLYRLRLLH